MASKFPFQVDVSSKYGAPMGRRSDKAEELTGRIHLRRVPLVDGDYDQGGAYWGGGRGTQPLFCAWDDEGNVAYLRFNTRADAKDRILHVNPNVTFYR